VSAAGVARPAEPGMLCAEEAIVSKSIILSEERLGFP
jgi:hypothetical protein